MKKRWLISIALKQEVFADSEEEAKASAFNPFFHMALEQMLQSKDLVAIEVLEPCRLNCTDCGAPLGHTDLTDLSEREECVRCGSNAVTAQLSSKRD